jgi:hypothetical protein
MEVILASCGNPDHYQDPFLPMWGCQDNCKLSVESLEEASRFCLEFIRKNDLGGGNWAGGQVLKGKKVIAVIEYNGAITMADDKDFNVKAVYWENELDKL